MTELIKTLEDHRNGNSKNKVFGLVLQGGGMRAAYSAGIIVPLVEAGLSGAFDHVIGSSAGGINGAYLLTADKDTYRTYTDSLTNKNFVNLTRLNKVVDIDYLIDIVLKHKRPINKDALINSPSHLHIVLTNSKTGKKEVISEHEEFFDIYEEFRATAAIPILYNKQVKLRGKYYIDGGVADLLPIDVAKKLGCTDIVVVLTQRLEFYHFDKAHTRLVHRLVKKFARNYPENIKRILPTNEKVLKKNLNYIHNPSKEQRIYLLQPSNEEILVSMASTDKKKITELAEMGARDMEAFLHKKFENRP